MCIRDSRNSAEHSVDGRLRTYRRLLCSESKMCIRDRDGGVLLGFGAYVRDSDMVRIFVAPGYQHKGIGSALLKFFEERYGSFSCRCYRHNAPAVNFLKNRGYAIIEKRQNVDSAAEEYVFRKDVYKRQVPASIRHRFRSVRM